MDEQMDLRNAGNLKNCSTFLPLSIGVLIDSLCLVLYIDVVHDLQHHHHNRFHPGCLLHLMLCSRRLHNRRDILPQKDSILR